MAALNVNFHKTVGEVKPMHAVNNGPVYKFAVDQRITNIDAFRDEGIPYARNHNAAFYSIAHKHLKSCFPHLKIGGPACARVSDDEWNVLDRFCLLSRAT